MNTTRTITPTCCTVLAYEHYVYLFFPAFVSETQFGTRVQMISASRPILEWRVDHPCAYVSLYIQRISSLEQCHGCRLAHVSAFNKKTSLSRLRFWCFLDMWMDRVVLCCGETSVGCGAADIGSSSYRDGRRRNWVTALATAA
jgi:hypothetical protein